MDYVLILYIAIALAVPVAVGFFVSRLILLKLAKNTGAHRGWKPETTVFHAIRLPTMAIAWLMGISLASMFLRAADLPHLQRVDWNLVDLWMKAVGTVAIFFVLYRFMLYAIRVAGDHTDSNVVILLRKILAAVFLVIAAITVLNQFGVQVGPVLASLGVAGLAAALALQDTLSNYIAGILIAVDKPIRIGDLIRIEGHEGFVESIGWRTTRIRPYAETIVVVPNSKVAGSVLVNLAYPTTESRIYVPVTIEYGSDLEVVQEAVVGVAKEVQSTVEGADAEFEPILIWDRFGDAGVEFRVVLRAHHFDDMGNVRGAFMKGLVVAFRDRDIQMARRLFVEPVPNK